MERHSAESNHAADRGDPVVCCRRHAHRPVVEQLAVTPGRHDAKRAPANEHAIFSPWTLLKNWASKMYALCALDLRRKASSEGFAADTSEADCSGK